VANAIEGVRFEYCGDMWTVSSAPPIRYGQRVFYYIESDGGDQSTMEGRRIDVHVKATAIKKVPR